MKVYPNQIVGYKENKIIFSDKSTLIYDDFKNKINNWNQKYTKATININNFQIFYANIF